MQLTRFAKYAWGVLAYNILVILWGAYVRATGSGAGCGSHWPLCNGEVIPRAEQVETLIEFAHRLTSGLSLLLVVGLLVWAFRSYPKGHLVRLGAGLSMFFIITEALVGAGLVLFEWVAQDVSSGRVISMAVHLVNTFLLLASLT
jgi:heme A synthase